MRLERFRGRDLATVYRDVSLTLGDDAMIAHSRVVREGRQTFIEVVAVDAREIARFRRQLTPAAPPVFAPRGVRRDRPYVVALVGPTGGGKTLTAQKLAVSDDAFGASRAGLLVIDPDRSGTFESLIRFADAHDLDVEVVHDQKSIHTAQRRLAACDVIIVDTPGCAPRAARAVWRSMLREINPDETHLVFPATTRFDLASHIREDAESLGVSHALLTKLDEVPNDANLAMIASALSLPARWITDGQLAGGDLHLAGPMIINAFDVAPDEQVAFA
ncbi:MAG: hypothetical protein NTZ43_09885 [Gemmatimonadetes bacterium]|nr:hypothetical protein [Gemmatimonadota bacterium]